MAERNIVLRVLDWLRAGYPQGIPQQDQVVLFGLLHRRLTQTEIEQVAAQLAADGRIDPSDEHIAEAIRASIHGGADDADINRVRSHLALGGWPLGDPDETEDDQHGADTGAVE